MAKSYFSDGRDTLAVKPYTIPKSVSNFGLLLKNLKKLLQKNKADAYNTHYYEHYIDALRAEAMAEVSQEKAARQQELSLHLTKINADIRSFEEELIQVEEEMRRHVAALEKLQTEKAAEEEPIHEDVKAKNKDPKKEESINEAA